MRGGKNASSRVESSRRRMTKLAKTPDHNQNTLSGGFEPGKYALIFDSEILFGARTHIIFFYQKKRYFGHSHGR